jgi:CRISPR-associated exonuclease Cas4
MEEAYEWQVKYYIWLLEQNGIEGVKGVLEYPKLRQTKDIDFTDEDQRYLRQTVQQIEAIIGDESCPPVINARFCKQCSYYDFCYITET